MEGSNGRVFLFVVGLCDPEVLPALADEGEMEREKDMSIYTQLVKPGGVQHGSVIVGLHQLQEDFELRHPT